MTITDREPGLGLDSKRRLAGQPCVCVSEHEGSQSEAGWWFWLVGPGGDRSLVDVRREYLEGFEDSIPEVSDED